MDSPDLSKGERTPRAHHLELAERMGVSVAEVQQLHDQFALEADVLYLLAQNPENFQSDDAWREAKTKVNALNPEKFRFDGGTVTADPTVPFIWIGSPNFWPNEAQSVVAGIQHTAVGTRASVRSTFLSPASQVSATGSVALNGDVDLFVDWRSAAWANGIVESGALPELIALFEGWNPNQRTLSLEREDGGNPKAPVPESQVRGAVAFWTRASIEHPEMKVLSGHNAISPRSRTCPESPWLDTGLLREIATAIGLGYLEY